MRWEECTAGHSGWHTARTFSTLLLLERPCPRAGSDSIQEGLPGPASRHRALFVFLNSHTLLVLGAQDVQDVHR